MCPGTTTFAQPSGTQVLATPTGYQVRSLWDVCSGSIGDQIIDINSDGTTTGFLKNDVKRSSCSIGRRPVGLALQHDPADCRRDPLAVFLADAARLEAASVHAFQRLERELRQLGAAAGEIADARRSAADEVRHTHVATQLAQRYGGEVQPPRVLAEPRTRSAFEIALENAVEGCVRETFGAVLAWHQAALARDPVVAESMREIAADETRHADLAWRVAGWLEPQLSEHERSVLQAARTQALEQLEREIARDELPRRAREQIGWPAATVQHALLQRMAGELALG
jgi:rubrerythrin